MLPDDVPDAERVSDDGFFELDTRMRRATGPAPERRSGAHRANWLERTLHFLQTDPGGCWVAEDETGMVNIVCDPVIWGRYRRVARESGGLLIRGMLERVDGVVNVVAERIDKLDLGVRASSRDFR